LQSDAVANHPNLWFQTSVNYHKLKNGKPINVPTATTSSTEAVPTVGSEGVQPDEAVKMETSGEGL
jgi:hypothetical protein